MDVSRIRALRGPNLWSRHTAIEAIVSCSEAERDINSIAGFETRLRERFPIDVRRCPLYQDMKEGVTPELVDAAFEKAYSKEFFIRLLGRGGYPSTKEVRGSNFCDIAWHIDERTHRVAFIIMAAVFIGAPLVGVYPVFMMKVMCFALFASAFFTLGLITKERLWDCTSPVWR